MISVKPPNQLEIGLPCKKLLGCISKDLVKIGDDYIRIRDEFLSYHDLYHLEVSCLERIKIGNHLVSGIHGINSPVLHDSPIVEEYSGILDEARVAIHEWLTRPSIFNTLKLIGWMLWLMTQGINPISALISHIRVLNKNIIYKGVQSTSSFLHS